MDVLILAAGLGTRLRPLTETRSKPSLPILGVSSIWFTLWNLFESTDLRNIIINGSHGWDSLQKSIYDKSLLNTYPMKIKSSDERQQILGSSGALKKVEKEISSETLLVINGDSICFPDLNKMIAHHKKNKSQLTLHLKKFNSDLEAYTNFEIEENSEFGHIKKLGNKNKSGIMFSGIYLIEKKIIKSLPDGISEFVPSILTPALKIGGAHFYLENAHWIDTGTVAEYVNAQKNILDFYPDTIQLIRQKSKNIINKKNASFWISNSQSEKYAKEIKTEGFVCLFGDLNLWRPLQKKFGPNFFGIEPPTKKIEFLEKNTVVLSDVVCKL